jgi:aminoglycoside phosphotransferase
MSIVPVPSAVEAAIADYEWQPSFGCSGTEVYRLTHPEQPTLYLKRRAHDLHRPLWAESERLHWLAGKLPVPKVVLFVPAARDDTLLITEIPGIDASDRCYGADVPNLVAQLAAGLRLIHSLSIADCPFDETLASKLRQAREQVEAGLVDPAEFDDVRRGRSAVEVLAELEATQPPAEDLVFTHGDYCLPNVLLHDGQIRGFIDLGGAGVADRYQDLALAARSLARNFGGEWVPLLFECYGLSPDSVKIEYYKLLDEFF